MLLTPRSFGRLAPLLMEQLRPRNTSPSITAVVRLTAQNVLQLQTTPGELRISYLPRSLKDPTPVARVEINAEKIHWADRHQTHQLIELARAGAGLPEYQCTKRNRCGRCPACVLRGVVNRESGKKQKGTEKQPPTHARVKHSLAYSVDEFDRVVDRTHFASNGEQHLALPGQYAGRQLLVRPGTAFLTIVEFEGVSPAEFVLGIHALCSVPRIGARLATMGNVEVDILGFHGGPGSIVSPGYLVQALTDLKRDGAKIDYETVYKVTEAKLASRRGIPRGTYLILKPKEVQSVLHVAEQVVYDERLLRQMEADATEYQKQLGQVVSGKNGREAK